MKKGILVLVLMLVFSCIAFGEAEEVSVTIPSFVVKINDVEFDSEYEQYPLITYKGITYLPMTWNMSKALGLNLQWSQEEGLRVKQGTEATLVIPKGGYKNNVSKSYRVNVITGKVTINGSVIDNAKAEYPLLSFNNITYFPMTYSYMVKDFNCQYAWHNDTGLSIKADNSLKLNLPNPVTYSETFTYEESQSKTDVKRGIFGIKKEEGDFYYVGFELANPGKLGAYYAYSFTYYDAEGKEIVTINHSSARPFDKETIVSGSTGGAKVIKFDHLVTNLALYPEAVHKIMNKEVLDTLTFESVKQSKLTDAYIRSTGAVRIESQLGFNGDVVLGDVLAYEYANNQGQNTKGNKGVSRRDLDGEVIFEAHNYVDILEEMSDITFEKNWMKFSYMNSPGYRYYGGFVKLFNESNELFKIIVVDYN